MEPRSYHPVVVRAVWSALGAPPGSSDRHHGGCHTVRGTNPSGRTTVQLSRSRRLTNWIRERSEF